MYFPEGLIYVQPHVVVPYVFSTPSDRYWIHVRTAEQPHSVLVGGDANVEGSKEAQHPLFDEPFVFETRYFESEETTTTTTTTATPSISTPVPTTRESAVTAEVASVTSITSGAVSNRIHLSTETSIVTLVCVISMLVCNLALFVAI